MATLKNQAHLKHARADASKDTLVLTFDCVVPTDIITTTPHGNDGEFKVPAGTAQDFTIPLYSRQWGTTAEFKILLDTTLTSEENYVTVCKRAGGSFSSLIGKVKVHDKTHGRCYLIHCNKIYADTEDCVICMAEKPTVVLQCGHNVMCETCKETLLRKSRDPLGLKCPTCRKHSRHYMTMEMN